MNKPYIIGIAGGSASGKTTLSGKLAAALEGLRVVELHMDKYFKKAEERAMVAAPVTGIKYRDDNHPTSFYMDQLKADIAQAVDEGACDVLIIEGLLTLWEDEVYNLLDLKLFVDCRADERIVRRLRRNMGWGLSFDEVSNVYLDMVRYRHDQFVEPSKWRADLIINGSAHPEKTLDMIVRYVRAECGNQ